MFGVLNRRALLCPNLNITIIKTPSFLHHFSSSKQHSFTTNYLINNFNFSPETASTISTRVRLTDSQNPDSILALFKSHGFTNSQLSRIIQSYPKLLSSDPNKTVLPKFNFFLSKGASNSDLVKIVTRNPFVLHLGLETTITTCYDFLKRFLVSDESTIRSLKYCTCLIYSKHTSVNVQVLLENGVPESKIAFLLRSCAYSACEQPDNFKKAVEEIKEMGFKPNSTVFMVALSAKMLNAMWERKIALYKKWGWSEEVVVSAFARYPWCMLASEEKIDTMMEFLVNRMGWDSLVLSKTPILLLLSLEKRVVPRSFVLQFLQSRGLVKDVKSATPFRISEKKFLQKFVNCFEEEEAAQLLKLYEEKKCRPR
ncbi:uncharacterized protein LOC130725745 [Lotus japonicus]|uniref:uncharacterized protein LOC130725745 n=1 Tax=Lotus japonicus TaxID=34305 RepID=UPI00258670FF|nr:uncharacterized protein LOC130725745 [Lotus japonicus]